MRRDNVTICKLETMRTTEVAKLSDELLVDRSLRSRTIRAFKQFWIFNGVRGPVAGLVGIEGGVVSGVSTSNHPR